MASRRFFTYDPYDYDSPSPYHYLHRYPYYYYQHPASARNGVNDAYIPAGGYDAKPAHQRGPRSRSVSVPVQFVGSEPDRHPAPGREELREPAAAPVKKRVRLSEEDAAVRVQAAVRGFLTRRMVREVRAVEREAEGVAARVVAEAEALRRDERGWVAVGETLMRLVLRLDAVRGAREYRRRVTKKVLALQDAVDALEPRAVVAAAPAAIEVAEAQAVQEGQVAPESAENAGHGVDMEAKAALEAPTVAEMEVDGATGERGAEDADNGMHDGEKQDEAEGEWEMVTVESEAAEAVEGSAAPEDAEQQQGPSGEEEGKNKSEGGASAGEGEEKNPAEARAAGVLDATKVMQMVAALCERSTQQCEVIGELAQRVDSLERAIRRVEDAERRRRRNKKLKKEGKGSSKSAARSCYSD